MKYKNSNKKNLKNTNKAGKQTNHINKFYYLCGETNEK